MRRLYPLWWKIGFAPECGLSSRRLEAAANVRFGFKTGKARHEHMFSALLPTADICALRSACPFGANRRSARHIGWSPDNVLRFERLAASYPSCNPAVERMTVLGQTANNSS